MKGRAGVVKSRFFTFCAILFVLGFFAIWFFHGVQQQIDLLRNEAIRCEQHQAAISAQFKSEVDKVSHLEQTQTDLQQKLKGERDVRNKVGKDSEVRFASLQQHYRILKSEHDDIKSEYAASKQKQLEQLDNYESRIKALKSHAAELEKQRVDAIEQWKFKYTQLEIQFNKLQSAMNRRGGVNVASPSSSSTTESSHSSTKGVQVQRSFDEQVLVADNTYQIPIHIHSSGGGAAAAAHTNKSLQNSLINNRSMDLNRRLPPSSTSPSSSSAAKAPQPPAGNGIINSVENFQMLPKPLPADEQPAQNANDNENVLKGPPSGDEKDLKPRSSTATLDKAELAKPIAIAQQQSLDAPPEQVVTSTKARKVPKGVVPIPRSMGEFLNNEAGRGNHKQIVKDPSTEDTLNNRYENAAAMHGVHNFHNDDKETNSHHNNQVNFLENGNEVENLAHEVNDFNIVEERNHHDHLQEGIMDDNAAEVEANHEGKDKGGEIDLTVINRELQLNEKEKGEGKRVEKVVNEDFVGDQGFDDHMEEHVEEEDDDEYSNLAARQEEGHAVRN